MKKKISLEDILPASAGIGLGTICEFGAFNALANPKTYETIQQLQQAREGTINLLPNTSEGAAIELALTGGILVVMGVLAAYSKIKEVLGNYEKL